MSDNLTIKQKKFVKVLPTADSLADAARKAGYSDASGAAAVRANELVRNSNVAPAIEREFERVAAKIEVTEDSIIAELQEAVLIAKAKNDSTSLTGAIMAKAKIAGLIIDKSQDVSKLTEPELLDSLYDGGVLQELISVHFSRTGKYLVESDSPTEMLKEA